MSLNSEVFKTLLHYMHERERIRLKKEAGESRPWTTDPILQSYKFTNVLRENDYTTQWLIKNWYEPNKDDELNTLLMNCGIARYFGTTEFCEAIDYQDLWQPEVLRSIAANRIANRQKVFTAAYVITNGGISDAKYNVVIDHYLDPFVDAADKLAEIAEGEQRWQPIAEYMMRYLPGFGGTGFMTKEVLSDFILATRDRIQWKDLYDWSPIGPGAVRGLNWLHSRPVKTKIPRAQALAELRFVAAEISENLEDWMPQFGDELDLHGIQFQMCEMDKYMRAHSGMGRPKANYTPR